MGLFTGDDGFGSDWLDYKIYQEMHKDDDDYDDNYYNDDYYEDDYYDDDDTEDENIDDDDTEDENIDDDDTDDEDIDDDDTGDEDSEFEDDTDDEYHHITNNHTTANKTTQTSEANKIVNYSTCSSNKVNSDNSISSSHTNNPQEDSAGIIIMKAICWIIFGIFIVAFFIIGVLLKESDK